MGDSSKGNARRIMNFIRSFNKVPDNIKNMISETLSKIESTRKLLDNPDATNRIRLRTAEENLTKLKR